MSPKEQTAQQSGEATALQLTHLERSDLARRIMELRREIASSALTLTLRLNEVADRLSPGELAVRDRKIDG